MFFGEFEHSIDSKGRLTIPAKFKDPLAGGVVITRGLDGCLWAYTRQEWQKVAEKIASLSMANREARQFSRFMFSSAAETIPDRNGRVIIPPKLLQHANIDRDVVVAGVMNKIEIWNPDRWLEEQTKVTEDPESLAAQLANLGIL